MSLIYKTITCLECGNSVTTEECPKCNSKTGLQDNDEEYGYPIIKCEDTNLTLSYYLSLLADLIIVAFFLFFDIILFNVLGHSIVGLIFLLITNVFATVFIIGNPITRYKTCMDIEDYGKEIEGIIYGVTNVDTDENGSLTYYVTYKILIEKEDGYKFLSYKLPTPKEIFKVNTKVILKEYEDKYMLIGEGEIK